MNFTIENIILAVSILLLAGVIGAKFSTRLGLPSLVLFIVVGMILNRFVFFDNAWLAQLLATVALVIILFEGGLQTKWESVKKVYKPSLSLATIGVVVTTVTVGAAAKFILDLTWAEGLLVGAIVGSTDAAAVFSVLGNKNVKQKLTTVLEAESASNDPMAIFLTISLIQVIQSPSFEPLHLVFSFFWQMGVGLILGIMFGILSIWIINKINLDSSGLYPVLSIALAIFAFSTVTIMNASGFLAVYVMAIIIGNADLTYRHSILGFNEGLAWMMQMVMFMILGLLVFPGELLHVAWQGIALAVFLMLIARPIGVFVSLFFSNINIKEKLFISWAGLKGAVPIILGTYPLVEGLEHGQLMFNVVFFVVLLSTVIQGTTISKAAELLNVTGTGKKAQSSHSLELISIGKANSEMVEMRILEESPAANKQIHEVRLPPKTLITAVVRGERLITPEGATRLLPEDVLYVLVKKDKKKELKETLMKKGGDS
ncbi:potassium/proton antiporter [Pseudobacillus badius]|uniref:potassium/proton antiporter n=1 Tax=Bacillus badius TaxID=1455 RepID=UPI001CC0D140|nr:potassium/proton antiporter [Bacillus badius]UAT30086.1 potassium/proton antiporter [Bacillus badius]GLY09517.1 K+/H+ antiporter [Bacillus badius]